MRTEPSTEKPECSHWIMFLTSRASKSWRSRKNAMTRWRKQALIFSMSMVDGGDVDELALHVEAAFQEQAVPMGVPATEGSRRLEDHDGGRAEGLACSFRGEVPHELVDEPTDLAVQPLVVADEGAEDLGQRERNQARTNSAAIRGSCRLASQRSSFSCISSQLSALVFVALPMRRAMSTLIPAR